MSIKVGIIASSRVTAAPPPSGLLLDAYPGAAIACSLRKLKTAYSGFCIQVKREIDNVTLNIGFVGGVLDTATLSTFIGAGIGRVSIWYDQSGNGNNLISPPSPFFPPKIINSGTIYTANSKPTIFFTGTEILDFTTTISSFNPLSLFLIQKANSTTSPGGLIAHNSGGGSGPAFGVGLGNNNQYTAFFGINGISKIAFQAGPNVGTNLNNMNMIVNATNFYPFANNTSFSLVTSDWAPSTTLFSRLGTYTGQTPNAYISEMVIYKTDQLANRTGIVSNTNSFYTLF